MSGNPYPGVPTVSWDDVALLTVAGFYDYPRSGTLRWSGQRRYFYQVADEYTYAAFHIVDLTPEEWEAEDQRNALFRQHVAEYDYENNRRVRAVIKPASGHHHFYDNAEPRNYPGRDPVAYLLREWDRSEDDDDDDDDAVQRKE